METPLEVIEVGSERLEPVLPDWVIRKQRLVESGSCRDLVGVVKSAEDWPVLPDCVIREQRLV
jgi:hypothetical protein